MNVWYVTTESQVAKETDVSEVRDAVSTVKDGTSEFFVVEPEPESERSFIQASTWTKGILLGRSFVMEIRVPEGDGFRQYRARTKKFEDIEAAVDRYLLGDAPEPGVWTDVTDEFLDDVADS
ncbi:MAG: hypothetical protein Q4Q58_00900 [Thermoplasmata archaeon]|nr:hypothetical protein [Thermoplasmata archaeon]